MKWRVERAGSPGHYIPAWIAYDPVGFGASFTTHGEAFAYAHRKSVETATLGFRALVKLGARR